MVKRLFDRCIITPENVSSSQENFKVIGTFNPGVAKFNNVTYFLVRVAEMPKETKEGFIALPRAKDGRIVIDWQKRETLDIQDERLLRIRSNNFLRLTNISHLRLAKSNDGVSFKKHGIIFTTENKDVVFFPEKINGRYVAFHRPLSANPFSPPEIWLAYSPDLIHWGDHKAIIGGNSKWGSMKVGAGHPPIKTEEGWLEIYHGSQKAHEKDNVGIYCAGAALFELNNPQKMIGRSEKPILVPEMEYEILKPGSEYEHTGFLPNIVFPTGIVAQKDELLIYNGAADTYTAVVKFSLQDVLDSIKTC